MSKLNASDLLPGWRLRSGVESREYYYNETTHETVWERPTVPPPPPLPMLLADCPSWIAVENPKSTGVSDKVYYVNTQTRKAAWLLPSVPAPPPPCRQFTTPEQSDPLVLKFHGFDIARSRSNVSPGFELAEDALSKLNVTLVRTDIVSGGAPVYQDIAACGTQDPDDAMLWHCAHDGTWNLGMRQHLGTRNGVWAHCFSKASRPQWINDVWQILSVNQSAGEYTMAPGLCLTAGTGAESSAGCAASVHYDDPEIHDNRPQQEKPVAIPISESADPVSGIVSDAAIAESARAIPAVISDADLAPGTRILIRKTREIGIIKSLEEGHWYRIQVKDSSLPTISLRAGIDFTILEKPHSRLDGSQSKQQTLSRETSIKPRKGMRVRLITNDKAKNMEGVVVTDRNKQGWYSIKIDGENNLILKRRKNEIKVLSRSSKKANETCSWKKGFMPNIGMRVNLNFRNKTVGGVVVATSGYGWYTIRIDDGTVVKRRSTQLTAEGTKVYGNKITATSKRAHEEINNISKPISHALSNGKTKSSDDPINITWLPAKGHRVSLKRENKVMHGVIVKIPKKSVWISVQLDDENKTVVKRRASNLKPLSKAVLTYIPPNTAMCSKCKKALPFEKFWKNQRVCKPCMNNYKL